MSQQPKVRIDINIDQIRSLGTKLFVATPMYGGMCTGAYTRALAGLVSRFNQWQLPLDLHFLYNESLITRARNYCVDAFLMSDATHMLFIDSDIGFKPDDVLAMLALQISNPAYDIIAAPYPKKNISWEKIRRAVNKGIGEENPNDLAMYIGDFVFNPIIPPDGQVKINLYEPAEIAEAGTGFMMIRRETFTKYKEAYPELSYRPDHARSEHHDGSREIHAYFDCIIDPESRRYLSEDYMFCSNARKAGMQVWMCPWMQLDHVGSYIFSGSIPHLSEVGADPTANEIRERKAAKKGKK